MKMLKTIFFSPVICLFWSLCVGGGEGPVVIEKYDSSLELELIRITQLVLQSVVCVELCSKSLQREVKEKCLCGTGCRYSSFLIPVSKKQIIYFSKSLISKKRFEL